MKDTINIGGKLLDLQEPIIMGIINITPDSFHKDSRFNPFDEDFLKKANEMLENGATIIDIGGYSSRPGALDISENEEIDRVIPAIEVLIKNFRSVTISIDTFRSKVAHSAIRSGAKIINDISSGDLDSEMFPLVIKNNYPYIMMHMRGNPETMQRHTTYEDLQCQILEQLYSKANYLRKNGVKDIIIDPGFGFSKTIEQNYNLLKHLSIFENENYPILIGISRKSMIYKLLKIDSSETLEATAQLHLKTLFAGANILRVHDVKSAKNTILLYEMLKKS
ncbi:FolP Dihydropteroate synthase and related enzymes [Spirosomataceae bacterium]|jgi:dihydropteroate synthase